MPCTTVLVGKNASYDGSTIAARNEDCGPGRFAAKKLCFTKREDTGRIYKAVISGATIDLPEAKYDYTSVPNADPVRGIWGESGVNSANTSMSATETLTSNALVLGADPLVDNGIGEEDLLTLVLPYIASAREGVIRLGMLTEKYGTYEKNGVIFQDVDEIWWFETIGGHHWMARRVPDDACVIAPNRQWLDRLDLDDAFGEMHENMCSSDLREFIKDNFLGDCSSLDVRRAFGSHTVKDQIYSNPRAWDMLRLLTPHTNYVSPESHDLPWCVVPESKLTIEDVKELLSLHFDRTEFDPYSASEKGGKYRPIAVNRTNFAHITQIRPYMPEYCRSIQWIAMGCNIFNAAFPFYTNVSAFHPYFSETPKEATSESFYWANRIIAALADGCYNYCVADIERYQLECASVSHKMVSEADKGAFDAADKTEYLTKINSDIAEFAKHATSELLDKVLYISSLHMKSAFARSDG